MTATRGPQLPLTLRDYYSQRIGPISSPYGAQRRNGPHTGEDYAAPVGTPIPVPAEVRILRRWHDSDGGYQVTAYVISGPLAGWRLGFAHLDGPGCAPAGEGVPQGCLVGFVGNSGRSTGPHLHLSVRDDRRVRRSPADARLVDSPAHPPAV
jgi:murein DD-endopeptidase MepM/ murein hydrolase activator NlpD